MENEHALKISYWVTGEDADALRKLAADRKMPAWRLAHEFVVNALRRNCDIPHEDRPILEPG
jgi:hypothetical protein